VGWRVVLRSARRQAVGPGAPGLALSSRRLFGGCVGVWWLVGDEVGVFVGEVPRSSGGLFGRRRLMLGDRGDAGDPISTSSMAS
jgi:hypothetical protein